GWYDGFRFTQGISTGLASVPTEQMKQGDFTNYGTYDDSGNWTVTPLVDPLTKTACGAMVCNNIVNPLDFDRVSKLILPLFPKALGDPRIVSNNYTNTLGNPTSVNEWGIKPDFTLNNQNRLSGLYFQGMFSTANIPLIPAPLGGGDQPSTNLTRNARINWNLTPRPNLTNQLTLAWNLWTGGLPAPSTWAGKSYWVDYLGLKGFAPNYKTQFPQFGIAGVDCCTGGGGASSDSQHSSNIKDMVNWSKGRHTAKFGFEYLKGADNSVNVGNSAGSFDFLNQETGSPGISGSGNGFASFLLGYADDVNAYHYNAPSYNRNVYWAAFVQDDIKVARMLTLNLGLRYDLFEPDWEKYNHKSWVDYSVPNPDANNILGAFVTATRKDRTGLNVYKTNFSPRVGLAYSLNHKTVIRAAFGVYYATGNANHLDSGSYTQGYNGTWSHASPDNGVTPGFIWGTDAAQPFVPSLALGAFLGQGSARHSAGTLMALDRTDSLPPYMENYTFGVQRQLPTQMVLTVAFVGNTGIHLASRVMPWDKMPPQYMPLGMTHICDGTVCSDPTQGTSLLYQPIGFSLAQQVPAVAKMPIDPATGNRSPFEGFEALYGTDGATLGQALRTAPQYKGTHRYYEGVGTSVYDALQVKLEKRFSDGLLLLVSYAWSKTLTNGGSIFGTFSSEFGTTTPWNAHAQKAYSFEDIPNNLSIAYVYDLPFGRGKRFMNTGGVANAILGGWKTSGILQYQSGRPQNVEIPDHTDDLEDLGWAEPNRVNGVPMASAAYHSGHFQPATPLQPGDSQFNSAAFTMPCEWCFGTLTPTEATVRDFYWPNEDLSLLKEWQLHESWSLTFRADFFNAFNRHVFGDNNGAYATEPLFGYPGFGTVGSQVDQPRCIQFGLRLKW
ncbi:MAG TPA: TonB-dependent receptor, partial [Terriglobia bacterium]|nr:TonB-dependent receptor [Terriglobia bacterium]